MKILHVALTLLSYPTIALSLPTPCPQPFEKILNPFKEWRLVRRANATHQLQFRIALAHSDPDSLHQTILEVSTPGHKRYSQLLKRHELQELIKPSDDTRNGVKSWLLGSGIEFLDIASRGDWIIFKANVSQAEQMMHTRFYIFHNARNGLETIRTLEYSIPEEVKQHVNLIHPTTRFGEVQRQGRAFARNSLHKRAEPGRSTTSCDDLMTPSCLRSLYRMDNYTASPNPANKLAVSNFFNNFPRFKDIALFQQKFAPWAVGRNFTPVAIAESEREWCDAFDQDCFINPTEADFDLQYALALASEVPVIAYATAGKDHTRSYFDSFKSQEQEPYLDFPSYVLDLPDEELPRTITTSWGEPEGQLPLPYARQVCNMFGQLGARGVSVLFASGDNGPGKECQRRDDPKMPYFQPIFPASCPHVTSGSPISPLSCPRQDC